MKLSKPRSLLRVTVGICAMLVTVFLGSCASSATYGTITEKEFIPAHVERSTEIIDGTHIPRSRKLPDCYKITITEDNGRFHGSRCVPSNIYDKVDIGEVFDFKSLDKNNS